jgi:protein-glutamine gamma-glutamyltransferase
MGRAGHDFALIKDHRANPAFFAVGDGGVFTLKQGVEPADAVRDIFASPGKYGFECATAMVIVYYKAMLDLLGDEDFNRICGDLRIGPWAQEGDLASVKRSGGSGTEPASAASIAALKPGEYRYIRNWDVSAKGKAAGWQGENVIYLGQGKYYGHPFGVASAETIISHLNTHRVDRSFFDRLFGRDKRREASMVALSGFMTRDVFRFDRNPNG